MHRQTLDFGNEPVGKLFGKLFVPTIVGMLSIVILNITDGAFIGHGVGGDALAAVNIAAPIYNIISGLGLMFGSGCSVIAAIHLSRGERREADLSVTRCLSAGILTAGIISAIILLNLDGTCHLFGSNDTLLPLARGYLRWIAIFMPLCMTSMMLELIIKLDGSPNYAMLCTLSGAVVNIVLDYLFIFPFGWGISGAALATGISFSLSGVLSLAYILFFSKTLHVVRPRGKENSPGRAFGDLARQMANGFSSFLGEAAVSCSVIIGNFIFIRYLGEAGVTAYSVACYLLPVAFMLGNAIAQSAQPVVSFSYGSGQMTRARRTLRVALTAAIAIGLAGSALFFFAAPFMTSIFISASEPAFELCCKGLPAFGSAFLFIVLNLALISYFQGMEQSRKAITYTLLRGYLLVIPVFLLLPKFMGTTGIWLAIPITEAITFLVILLTSRRCL